MRDNLVVGGMIAALDADELLFEVAGVLVNVPDELELGRARAENQELAAIAERIFDLLKERAAGNNLAGAGRRAGFVMQVAAGEGRADELALHILLGERKNACLAVIDPNNATKMVHDLLSGLQSTGVLLTDRSSRTIGPTFRIKP